MCEAQKSAIPFLTQPSFELSRIIHSEKLNIVKCIQVDIFTTFTI